MTDGPYIGGRGSPRSTKELVTVAHRTHQTQLQRHAQSHSSDPLLHSFPCCSHFTVSQLLSTPSQSHLPVPNCSHRKSCTSPHLRRHFQLKLITVDAVVGIGIFWKLVARNHWGAVVDLWGVSRCCPRASRGYTLMMGMLKPYD
jgi:hypothetical protein